MNLQISFCLTEYEGQSTKKIKKKIKKSPHMVARILAWICKNLIVLYLRVARRQRTDRGQINAEGLNVNIF